jgi:hypothetical protein
VSVATAQPYDRARGTGDQPTHLDSQEELIKLVNRSLPVGSAA